MARAEVPIPKRRISGGTKAAMILVALALDFSVLIIGALLIIGSVAVGSGSGKIIEGVTASKCGDGTLSGTLTKGYSKVNNVAANTVGWLTFGVWHGISASSIWEWTDNSCGSLAEGVGSVGGAVVGTALVGTFMLFGGMGAIIVATLALLLSVSIFTVWFLAKGVNPWAINFSRMGINMLAFVLESIPIINMLVPMQTVAVWGHIRVANKEDDAAIRAAQQQNAAAAQRAQKNRPNRNPPVLRTASV